MSLMWQKYSAVFVLAAALSAGCAPASFAQDGPAAGTSIALPALTLIDGRTLPAGYFLGKPVVIEYWASWCPFCARQNPYLQKLTLQARDKGLEILTVSIDRREPDAQEYVKKHRYTFPVAMETPQLRAIFGKRKVIPQIFVIDAHGKLAESIPGEMFEEDVLDLLKYAPARH
jgi:thiol-disulfide isomerase/thioredoxin